MTLDNSHEYGSSKASNHGRKNHTASTVHSNLRRIFGKSKTEDSSYKTIHFPGGGSSDRSFISASTGSLSTVNDYDISPTQEQIDLVRISWERVSELRLPNDDANVSPSHSFGLAFYDALFKMDSSLKQLFTNVFQQARALTGMISYIARAPAVTNGNIRGSGLLSESHPFNDTSSIAGEGNRICPFTGIERTPQTNHQANTIHEINASKQGQPMSHSDSDIMPGYDEGDPEWLVYKLTELGARHCYYNVKPEHLSLVGPAFVEALKVRLGNEYDPRIGEAWLKAHGFAAYHMKIGLESQLAWESGAPDQESHRQKTACTIQ